MNADNTQYIKDKVLSSNLYTYCLNNPVSYADSNGKFPIIATVIFGITAIATTAVAVKSVSESLTIFLYMLSFANKDTENLYDLSNYPKFVNEIKNSYTIKNFLKDFNTVGRYENLIHEQRKIRYFYGEYDSNNRSIFNLSFYNDFKDLKFSIGKASVSVTAVLTNILHTHLGATVTNWRLFVTLSDRYDFDSFDPQKKGYITSLINNKLGYDFQKDGKLTPYEWKITFYLDYQYTCFHGVNVMYVGDLI